MKPAVPEKPAAAVAEPVAEDEDQTTILQQWNLFGRVRIVLSRNQRNEPNRREQELTARRPHTTGLPSIKTDLSTSRPISSSSSKSLTIKIPPHHPGQGTPLEALYKRVRPAELSTAEETRRARLSNRSASSERATGKTTTAAHTNTHGRRMTPFRAAGVRVAHRTQRRTDA